MNAMQQGLLVKPDGAFRSTGMSSTAWISSPEPWVKHWVVHPADSHQVKRKSSSFCVNAPGRIFFRIPLRLQSQEHRLKYSICFPRLPSCATSWSETQNTSDQR